MPTVILTKAPDGKLRGTTDIDEKRYARFRTRLETLMGGDSIIFSWTEPRNPAHHGLWFAKLQALYSRQERFSDIDHLRVWITVGAGFCDVLSGPRGIPTAIPRSISWATMDEAGFREFHDRTDEFMRSEHAQEFLWPSVHPQARAQGVEDWIREFSDGR